MKAFYVWLALGLVSACSSSNPTDDGGSGDASNDLNVTKDTGSDVVQSNDSATDAPASEGGNDAGTDASSGTYTLTINDYLAWCNVSVDGSDAGSSPPTYQFAPDASVSLHGDTKSSSFYWGYWQAPSLGDGGKDTNMNVTITMNGNVTILACCPVTNTPLSCP